MELIFNTMTDKQQNSNWILMVDAATESVIWWWSMDKTMKLSLNNISPVCNMLIYTINSKQNKKSIIACQFSHHVGQCGCAWEKKSERGSSLQLLSPSLPQNSRRFFHLFIVLSTFASMTLRVWERKRDFWASNPSTRTSFQPASKISGEKRIRRVSERIGS